MVSTVGTPAASVAERVDLGHADGKCRTKARRLGIDDALTPARSVVGAICFLGDRGGLEARDVRPGQIGNGDERVVVQTRVHRGRRIGAVVHPLDQAHQQRAQRDKEIQRVATVAVRLADRRPVAGREGADEMLPAGKVVDALVGQRLDVFGALRGRCAAAPPPAPSIRNRCWCRRCADGGRR